MRKSAKERVYDCLIQLNQSFGAVTAEKVAEQLDISRQNASHYLSRLLEERAVAKIPGKPVRWEADLSENGQLSEQEATVFRKVIGYNGSLKEAIQQCIAAVKYPPNGLSVLITGDTGVGKSYLAKQIHDYAVEQQVLAEDAPFVVLNCADYADNPELLAATLFGYKKGAFTGAESDTQGLLAAADTGYLFLDEVHRLSKENQEKLFLFMDSGNYRPIGENQVWSTSNVRFIFATTERKEEYLLDTFARRIQLSVELPPFHSRPLMEKLHMIETFFHQEAQTIQRDILLTKEALTLLVAHDFTGNVGGLKNIVKISCASVFSRELGPVLRISEQELAQLLELPHLKNDVLFTEDVLVEWQKNLSYFSEGFTYEKQLQVIVDAINQGLEVNEGPIKREVLELLAQVNQAGTTKLQKLLSATYQYLWNRIVMKKYGLVKSGAAGSTSSVFFSHIAYSNQELQGAIKVLTKNYPRSAHVAEQFIAALPKQTFQERQQLLLILILVLSDYVDEKIELKGLLLAHGESTATSIQSVVNQLCENYVFEALDMPVESNVSELVEQTKSFVHKQVNTDSLVLIVDMGSLNQIYTQIKNDLKGELLLINNLTTSIALDIGLKMSINAPFDRIAEDANANYSINVQYFEGFAKKSNIIISCMSGLGISDKLKDIFREHLSSSNLEVFTKEYKELKTLINQNEENYFNKTKLVITTSDLPKSFAIDNINIYNVLDEKGGQQLEELLSEEMNPQEFQRLIEELVKFFSFEGIADRLTFLNPALVMGEVESAVAKYENYYQFKLHGKVKLNLYMHTALMIERLFLARTEKTEDILPEMSKEAEEFHYVSRSIFQPMEMKFNFKVTAYEISLLYELLGPFIEK
ncbi:sigma 54-interacting transcriptional regulator [Enterococcus pallens]|uniref:Transcriptional activator n=1 Tax=Enterococcus pallens ATCC BAA-351 TaxID=1158607 RepID=R2QMH4_9ENTE|nr:sigma-54-dependent transcriptional regulator [Enterococcus pallens]EOH97777.1 transcriptional activator [Enterococcus pallens ATCC BAA-351]EOU20804.1 transcriptional activator [Enterococcus pallens ATCC BAA-351]OJG76024.1 transcriptional activator [Enterococcus pallens]